MPRQVDHRQRREEIARALWRVVDTSGALRLSLREVAKEAGMSHGQVQHYFTSRRELLLFATDFAAERTAERIAAGLADLGPDPHPRDLLRLTLTEMLPLHPDARATSRMSAAYVLEALHDDELRVRARDGMVQARAQVEELAEGAFTAAALVAVVAIGLTMAALAFVVLGLLVHPPSLLDVWQEGLIISLVLIFVARPLAVLPILLPFGFNAREIALVSWVGLRGSVPIILAIFPLIFGLSGAPLIFNVVFFVVLISATVQGSTLPIVARKLGLAAPPPPVPPATLEITALGDVDADIVEYILGDTCRAAGRRLSQMALPDSTVVAMITRQQTVIPPRGSTTLEAGDHLFVVLRPETRPFVDRVFSSHVGEAVVAMLPAAELRLKGTTRIEDLLRCYGIDLAIEGGLTLDQVLRRHLGDAAAVDASVTLNGTVMRICEMVDRRIATVGLERSTEGAGALG